MPSALGRGIDDALREFNPQRQLPLNDKIPIDPQTFYKKLGPLKHPATGQTVESLAPYQVEAWQAVQNYKRVLVVKSNKIGLTTSSLMMDIQLALLPTSNPLSTRGYDTLLLAQTKDIAKEHLRAARKMLMDSKRFGKYLIESPSEIAETGGEPEDIARKVMKSEQTKTGAIYLRNPENEKQPSRIIALGMNNAGAILSWRNVKHLHVSDPTATEGDYTEAIDNALSRLANTGGSCLIETIPSGPEGKIYNMFKEYTARPWQAGDFKTITITADQAVAAGVISKEFLDSEAKRLGPLYPMYYGAEFTQGAGNIFNNIDIDACLRQYDLSFGSGYKILAADPAFSKNGSKFGLLGIEQQSDGISYVKYCQQFQGATTSQMIDTVYRIFQRDRYDVLLVDSAYPGFIADWQQGGEPDRHRINAQSFSFAEKATTAPVNAAQMVNQLKVAIHPQQFAELVRQMRTCRYDSKGKLDKSGASYDLIDCLSMALDPDSAGWGGEAGSNWAYLPSGGL